MLDKRNIKVTIINGLTRQTSNVCIVKFNFFPGIWARLLLISVTLCLPKEVKEHLNYFNYNLK